MKIPNLITDRTVRLPGDYVPQGSQDQKEATDAPDGKCGPGNGLPAGAVAEFRFHPTRRWRFDWAWPSQKVALEIEGGAWTRGRHTRGKGFVRDMEKYNQAVLLGWRVLRVTPKQVTSGEAGRLVRAAIQQSGGDV
jgi:hypothetical protein